MTQTAREYQQILDDQTIGTYWISEIECAVKAEHSWVRLPMLRHGQTDAAAVETGTIAYVMQNVTWSLS